ncbi:hypothetical protein I4U23_003188 [Adineta vaga]|nr:hypothetical protein I4U23_003188 [Adineta vaga]
MSISFPIKAKFWKKLITRDLKEHETRDDMVLEQNSSFYSLDNEQENDEYGIHMWHKQQLRFISHAYFDLYDTLQDNHKLGDYITVMNDTCKYILKVFKGKEKKAFIFDSIPNVTHYEYVQMSSHVYQPNEPFLDGWYVKPYNLSNKNGLFLVAYIYPANVINVL